MNKTIMHYAATRHSTKAFDATKKISAENIENIKQLLRISPSSVNSQPWHFILASSAEAKAKIAKATETLYPFNSKSILNASHVVIFCSKTNIEDDYLLKLLEQEAKDGRFAADMESGKSKTQAGRSMFVNIHKNILKDVKFWMEKQVYLNLGAFLLGLAALGIDAVPMEGIDTDVLNEEFDLLKNNYSSLVVVPIGYHDTENDFNAILPKSRLPYSEILTEL